MEIQEITVTIQSPPGIHNEHPLASSNNGPRTKFFLHFLEQYQFFTPLILVIPKKTLLKSPPPPGRGEL